MKFLASHIEYTNKINICKTCEEYNIKLRTCGICKCIMPVKARLSGNTCPLGKHI